MSQIVINPVSSDLEYIVVFEQPLFNYISTEWNLHVLGKMTRLFGLKLNDIKLNQLAPSDNIYHFTKYYGGSTFDVSFGLDQITSQIRNVSSEGQVLDLNLKLAELYSDATIVRQKFSLYQQAEVGGDVNEFLNQLNPWSPIDFNGVLVGKGANYHLEFQNENAELFFTVANSLPIKGGLFISGQLTFEPNKYDFKSSFDLGKTYYNSLVEKLGAVQVKGK